MAYGFSVFHVDSLSAEACLYSACWVYLGCYHKVSRVRDTCLNRCLCIT